jgi:hypothetical protein
MTAAAGELREAAAALLHDLRPLRVTSVRVTHNQRLIIGLRGSPRAGLRLGIHAGLVVRRTLWPSIAAWIGGASRRPPDDLQAAIDEVFQAQRTARVVVAPELEPIGQKWDAHADLDRVLAAWFPHLPRPALTWGRQAPRRRRKHIRFACYRRSPPTIVLSPLVDQPWVARRFLEYLLFHELCHHAQACRPMPGETAHSPRFQSWERRYPHLEQVLAWEQAHLDRFLAAPPT